LGSVDLEGRTVGLDCYPYSFSPLLLFSQSSYFDKGHSNYNAVASFFAPVLGDVNMLENVVYDRKNLLYEELYDHVTKNNCLVTMCIDSHFTAFQVLPKKSLIYYDPMKSSLQYMTGDSYTTFVCYMLLKCNYGDSQHIQEHQDHYKGEGSNNTRRIIHRLWRDIHKMEPGMLRTRSNDVTLNLDKYLLINNMRDPKNMSTQATGNTCYFQTYLFAVLCKVCAPTSDGYTVELANVDKLEQVTVDISRFLLEFFMKESEEQRIMRPLTNSNFVCDFFRFTEAEYYAIVTQYLGKRHTVPDYKTQYEEVLKYYFATKMLHRYGKFQCSGTMPSTLNTKSLQPVTGCDDGGAKLGLSHYYKYRAANLMFGFNTGMLMRLQCFPQFNALRKNQLLAFYDKIAPIVRSRLDSPSESNQYRDYYFMPQFEVGQQELVDLHHYTYEIDLFAMLHKNVSNGNLAGRVQGVNAVLMDSILFSTQRTPNYEKFMDMRDFKASKEYSNFFLNCFMSMDWFNRYAGLGFPDINPREKEFNSLTQTSFYSNKMMQAEAGRMAFEFEKQCINEMARSTLRKQMRAVEGKQNMSQKYSVSIKIGHGFTYSKYNTLMHFLNVSECYWLNPDLNGIQVFGKDIRTLLAISCQKIFFEQGHNYYHYGPIEMPGAVRSSFGSYSYGSSHSSRTSGDMDLQVSSSSGELPPYVSKEKEGSKSMLVVTDRVYEFGYLKAILDGMFDRAKGARFKTDDVILNLSLLSLMLDFGLCQQYSGLLNLPFIQSLKPGVVSELDTKQLQVEVSNLITDFDKKNGSDSVTRLKVEELIFEASYKFMVNKNFSIHSKEFELIRQLNADPVYHRYLLLVKIYVSLCQINKSVEVDYYKIRCNNDYRIIIPQSFSKSTSDYLEQITKRYTFSENEGFITYDELKLYDVREAQPEIDLYKVRFDSDTAISSMVKYIEISNVFRAFDSERKYLVFIADNALLVDIPEDGGPIITINKIPVEIATMFFNEAISFVPCFKYADSEDVILFTSRNIHYLVDRGGQFNENYYGMKFELIECISTEQVFIDLNDEHVFKSFKLNELLTESKTVIYFPDYLLQVQSQQQLINLLDMAIYVRNISFFILVLFYLRRASVMLSFETKDKKVTKITGPWLDACKYVILGSGKAPNPHYDKIFEKQFFDLNQHKELPLPAFVDVLCDNFTRYQRQVDGQYQIVPTQKQKEFLQRIITAEECFHFSEVGSGKTKVILPLLCQVFLSNNIEAHHHLARGGEQKHALVILVPEHLVPDALSQVYRYCLNLNFRDEYRVHDNIFALLHDDVQLRTTQKRDRYEDVTGVKKVMKQIFVTSFNSFKKALTYDEICAKVQPNRKNILIVTDEVDDFLDRDKLVFNICSNKGNAFQKPILDRYFEVSQAVYRNARYPTEAVGEPENPAYWSQLHEKFGAINLEIQEKSKSINKNFGIFNEKTLRHCSSNVAHDIEGYKSLIARPYESVNRAMPGSYYSDVERTIYLTYYILMEDVSKYDELFQQERKFINFEYFNTYLASASPASPRQGGGSGSSPRSPRRTSHTAALDYDDLVYGSNSLSELVEKHPETKDGLTRFLYGIILRRMEIRDKSRSVNSIDVVFNFDCIGFTGTPFIDNYPTFSYIQSRREDNIPDLIDKSFYVYASDNLDQGEFESRFAKFQGKNSNVMVEYVPSDFVDEVRSTDELEILSRLFDAEAGVEVTPPADTEAAFNDWVKKAAIEATSPQKSTEESMSDMEIDEPPTNKQGPIASDLYGFNVVVDLCGIFKKTSVYEVKALILKTFGLDRFKYIYHIDQTDGSDRVLYLDCDNDVQFDEEFYKYLCNSYGASLREKVFFFVDNRNVIGKDIPFQLIHQRRFQQPMFYKSVVLAHDVDDFSKIWQAMGRSRTMNETAFTIYKSGVPAGESRGVRDIKKLPLTRQLYMSNCDRKMAGNLSSIYQSLISLYNLSQDKFYYCDEIINVFLEKMMNTISRKVSKHEENIAKMIFGSQVPSRILEHILGDKFAKSSNVTLAKESVTIDVVQTLVGHIIQQKYEQRVPSGDIYDEYICFLSGEQASVMEISYTKQQQKQKQKQQNKNQDSDTMEVFDKKNQLVISDEMDNYFKYTLDSSKDLTKHALSLPLAVPILKLSYKVGGTDKFINVYPTLQFLYSHHINAEYITPEVRDVLSGYEDTATFYKQFLEAVGRIDELDKQNGPTAKSDASDVPLDVEVLRNNIRQTPQYTFAALREGVYVIGMKDQFNIHDIAGHPLKDDIQYIADEMGFILYDKGSAGTCGSVDSFGPYFIEQYILMEVLSKQEVAQNVMDYYINQKEKLQSSLEHYGEAQGKGFICWRFIHERRGAREAKRNEPMASLFLESELCEIDA